MAGTRLSGTPARGYLIGLLVIAVAALAILVAAWVATLAPGGTVAATSAPSQSPAALPTPSDAEPSPTSAPPTPPPPPPPTPIPTPVLVPAPLTGQPVTPAAAARQPIAVMIDDHEGARPQSGFNAASVVWHAPAEAGIPRYMLIFQDEIPSSVGPVRSARQYYIEWAAEWNAMYVHAGGSPQAIATLNAKGQGQWVYNADEFRWGGRFLWRETDRFAPHNVYSDGKNLRTLAKRLEAVDEPLEPAWSFAPDAAIAARPSGGTIRVVYPYERITYKYDRATNRYVRYLNASTKPQVDRMDGEIVAPSNVVILRMVFSALNDGHPNKYRLQAQNVGEGEAWISTNGTTVKGTWSKASRTAPTLLFDQSGRPITLTAGQTFVQVIPMTYRFKINDGPKPTSLAPDPQNP